MSISSDWMGALGMLSKGLFSCVLSWSLAFSVGSSTSWECARASGLTGTTSNGSCRWEYLSRIYKYSLPGVQRECFDYVSEADESALAYYYYSKMWSRPLPYLHIKELHEVRSRSRIMLLAGPWWWNWHFGGEESGPLLRIGFLPSLENKLSCRHQGKGPRLYTAAEAESKGLVER